MKDIEVGLKFLEVFWSKGVPEELECLWCGYTKNALIDELA
jgi:hypothetical protein